MAPRRTAHTPEKLRGSCGEPLHTTSSPVFRASHLSPKYAAFVRSRPHLYGVKMMVWSDTLAVNANFCDWRHASPRGARRLCRTNRFGRRLHAPNTKC